MIRNLVILIVFGVIFFLIDKFMPMAEPFKIVFRIIGAIIAIVLLLRVFGIVIPGVPAL